MTKIRAFSRLSEALGTGWRNRFATDLFFRTEVIIIATLFFLCFLNVAIIAIAFNEIHLEIAALVVRTIGDAISLGSIDALNASSTSAMMAEGLRDLRNTYLTVIAAVSVMVTLLFGYVVARVALAPARNALAGQKQFIANIAHELRTPLSIIRANSEIMLLEKNQAGSATMTESNIEELDRVSGIINNLLTLNSFRHIDHMNFERLILGDIAKDAVKKMEKLAMSKGITLDIHASDMLPVWGNKSGLSEIAINLVKNAITYTPPKGTVTVDVEDVGVASVGLRVTDTGIGIEREELRRIFEPFYRVDPSRSKRAGGSGLGLAIVSELVKFHHGKISVASTPGTGTAVTAIFPSKEKRVTPPDADESRGAITMDFSKK